MVWFIAWLAIAVFTGIIAASKGRDGFGWFLLGCLFSLIALIAAAAMPAVDKPAGARGALQDSGKTCPDCAETVKREARLCRFCGHQFSPSMPTLAVVPANGEPYVVDRHPVVVQEGKHRGWPVRHLQDGTIAAKTLSGWRRFASTNDLEAYGE